MSSILGFIDFMSLWMVVVVEQFTGWLVCSLLVGTRLWEFSTATKMGLRQFDG